MPKKVSRWTKRCADGRACGFGMTRPRAFIPDEYEVCDGCLVAKYDLRATYDACDDPHAMRNLYHEDEVLAALRRAENEIPTNYLKRGQ